MSKYEVYYEETQRDKEEFYAQGGGKNKELPRLDPDRILKRWVALLEEQNGENFDDYVMQQGHKVERYLETWAPPPKKVLFLGTGTGREVHAARLYGYESEGTTLGKENIPFAKWKFDLDLFYGDNCTLPYEDKSFDVVCGFQVFEHCHSPYLFLVECCRVLREGGLILLEWPAFMQTKDGTSNLTPGNMQPSYMQDYDDDNLHHLCCWTPAQAWIMVRRCGFEDVEVFLSNVAGSDNSPGVPHGLSQVTENESSFWTNVSPGDVVLKAKRRPDSKQPSYMERLLAA